MKKYTTYQCEVCGHTAIGEEGKVEILACEAQGKKTKFKPGDKVSTFTQPGSTIEELVGFAERTHEPLYRTVVTDGTRRGGGDFASIEEHCLKLES